MSALDVIADMTATLRQRNNVIQTHAHRIRPRDLGINRAVANPAHPAVTIENLAVLENLSIRRALAKRTTRLPLRLPTLIPLARRPLPRTVRPLPRLEVLLAPAAGTNTAITTVDRALHRGRFRAMNATAAPP